MITLSPLNTVLDRMVTLSRAMDEALAHTEIGETAQGTPQQYWVPGMDAWETENAFVVQLDLAGLSPEQVELSFDRNTLTVRGSRPATIQAPEKGEIRVFFAERPYGAFSRSLRFPQYVESDRIEANFSNGVLTITVPKAEQAKPRKIAINAPVEAQQLNA
jgi:HSP20 family protein